MTTEIPLPQPAATGHSVPEVEGKPMGPEGGLPEEFRKQIGDNKNVPWYKKDLGAIDKQAHELLEKYSGIPADNINDHILNLRDRAWSVWPYPCIGTFLFLDLSIASSPSYPQVIKRIQNGDKLLDLGCCFAQDIRKLVYDGAPAENIWGTDLEAGFIDLGYQLFLDKDTLKAHFFASDALDPDSALNELKGQISIIYAGFFFHLFTFDQAVEIVVRLIGIMKPEKGSLILGKQAGCPVADEKLLDLKAAGKLWRHSPASFTKVWEVAGEKTGSKWRVNAWLEDDGVKEAWVKMKPQWMSWEIEREE